MFFLVQVNVSLAVGLSVAALVVVILVVIVAGYFIYRKYGRYSQSSYEPLSVD